MRFAHSLTKYKDTEYEDILDARILHLGSTLAAVVSLKEGQCNIRTLLLANQGSQYEGSLLFWD